MLPHDSTHEDLRINYLMGQAAALYQLGDEFGDNAAMLSAIEGVNRRLVTLVPASASRVEGASGDRTVQLASAGTTTNGIGVCDLVIIATKAFDVEAAARSSVSLIGPETLVQTIQNGLGSPEVAATVLGGQYCRR